MGVRGLTTFVNQNQESFLKPYWLHDTNVVIDGHSLCAQLFKSCNSFPAFGGNYDRFAATVKNFFKNLKKCNVTCYILFDGGYEMRKLKTAFSRLRSKISGASHLDVVNQSSMQIFPLLLRETFKEVLKELKIAFTVCELEADDEIAALARYLDCPVLSYDSDFFIYNVLYIPFNTMDYKPILKTFNSNELYAIECKLFKSEYLVKKIQIKVELMPLLATLLGNDFVQKKMFNNFFSHLKLPKSRTGKNEQQRSIQGLITWLQNETLDTAIAKIIGRVKKSQKNKVLHIIQESLEGYNCCSCKSLQYFNLNRSSKAAISEKGDKENESKYLNSATILVPETNNDSENDNDLSDSCDTVSENDSSDKEDDMETGIPEWLSERIRNNIVPQASIDLYTSHMDFCCPQAEDYSSDDSTLCTLPIIRYIFDILTDFKEDAFIFISRENNNNYKKIIIGPEFAIEKPLTKSYSELSLLELKVFMDHFLKVKFPNLDLLLIERLPSNFHLIMLAILWWVKHCNVPKSYVHSLLISHIMLDVVDEKTGTFRGAHFFNNKFRTKLEELRKRNIDKVTIDENDLYLNKNKVLYEDCLVACNVLLQHFELSNEIRKKPKSYDVKMVHVFAQFQCCLLQLNCLNSLCNYAFPSTRYSKFYNGTFVYNLSCKLNGSEDPAGFLDQYLKGAHTVLLYYESLCIIMNNCFEQVDVEFCSLSKFKRRRRKKKGKSDISFLAEEFASEVFI